MDAPAASRLDAGRQRGATEAAGLALAVCVGAVVNVHHGDGTRLVIDLIHHAVVAATCGMVAGKLEMQRAADPFRVVSQ